MLTDAPPRKTSSARFLQSDRMRTLDLPQDRTLLATAKSIESGMRAGSSADVRRPCAEFLDFASAFTKSRAAVFGCLQHGHYESAKTGRVSSSATMPNSWTPLKQASPIRNGGKLVCALRQSSKESARRRLSESPPRPKGIPATVVAVRTSPGRAIRIPAALGCKRDTGE